MGINTQKLIHWCVQKRGPFGFVPQLNEFIQSIIVNKTNFRNISDEVYTCRLFF